MLTDRHLHKGTKGEYRRENDKWYEREKISDKRYQIKDINRYQTRYSQIPVGFGSRCGGGARGTNIRQGRSSDLFQSVKGDLTASTRLAPWQWSARTHSGPQGHTGLVGTRGMRMQCAEVDRSRKHTTIYFSDSATEYQTAGMLKVFVCVLKRSYRPSAFGFVCPVRSEPFVRS
jgi:hypothetical protein